MTLTTNSEQEQNAEWWRKRLVNECGNRLVSRVVAEDGWAAEVIFDIAAGDKTHWTPLEWAAVLSDLERCKLKVKDWV